MNKQHILSSVSEKDNIPNVTCLWMKKWTVHVSTSWKEFARSLFRSRWPWCVKSWHSRHVDWHYVITIQQKHHSQTIKHMLVPITVMI